MDAQKSSAPQREPTTQEEGRQPSEAEDRPCACIGGWVFLGIEEDGVEHVEAVPCRRCPA